jgi:hypothetical protein
MLKVNDDRLPHVWIERRKEAGGGKDRSKYLQRMIIGGEYNL